jgi:putative ubiquitin-RnfH superfamily antitoxin RatB of RatAB toxin-antitoxin module
MNILLVYSPAPRQLREWTIQLPAGASVALALKSCPILQEFPELNQQSLLLGVWGKRVTASHLLRDQDRLEIYRALRVDPKIARRERFSRQGVKRAGLFATTRAGAKAGY